MIRRAALVLLVVIAAFGAGYVLGGKTVPPARIALSCTPSAPETIVRSTDAPVILFWGNSLLHDHDWRMDGAVAVNCALQGLTAAAAAPMIASLPDVEPDVIVLAFGSVELIRAGRGGDFSEDAFSAAVTDNVAALKARWSNARQILTSAPSFRGLGGDEQIDLGQAGTVNAALSSIAEEDNAISYFEMSALYKPGGPDLPGEATYDGVHLTRAAYQRWQAALNLLLQARR